MIVTERVQVTDVGVVVSTGARTSTADAAGESVYVENPEENTVSIYWCGALPDGSDAGVAEGKRLRPGEGFGMSIEASEVVRVLTTAGQVANEVEIVRGGVGEVPA